MKREEKPDPGFKFALILLPLPKPRRKLFCGTPSRLHLSSMSNTIGPGQSLSTWSHSECTELLFLMPASLEEIARSVRLGGLAWEQGMPEEAEG